MWQNPLRSFGYAESGILPHRFGGLHPQMLLVATRTSHICEFAKSQERKQTSFLGLRKSAESLGATQKHNSTTNTTKQNANTLQSKKELQADTQANAFTAHLILRNGTHNYILDYGF